MKARGYLRALAAAQAVARRVVYVRPAARMTGRRRAARDLGVTVIELDASRPFTAARGRNTGLAALPDAEFVQFIDGDCILQPDWPMQALSHLHAHSKAGLVFGRQFEAAPDASVYNWMTDWEWNKTAWAEHVLRGLPNGARRMPLRAIAGYNEDLIAGEDDDMCHRMQSAGWQTWCIDTRMTEHDARAVVAAPRGGGRSLRAGHSYAETWGAARCGGWPKTARPAVGRRVAGDRGAWVGVLVAHNTCRGCAIRTLGSAAMARVSRAGFGRGSRRACGRVADA